MIKIILGAIVVVFVFWGVGSYTSRRSGQVASVNGTIITLDDYRITYSNLVEQVRQSFGNNLNEELIEMLQLRKRALDQLIDRSLMLQAAEKFKLTVSDEELSESIRNISAFQTAGAFDGRRYINTLNRNKITPETFEIQQRDAILIDKLQAFISGNIKVSDPPRLILIMSFWNRSSTKISNRQMRRFVITSISIRILIKPSPGLRYATFILNPRTMPAR
jgi:peptidyl-prolyl cis-trans isomerase D